MGSEYKDRTVPSWEPRRTTEDRLAQLERRQEHLIATVQGLTDITAQTRDLVTELMAWLREPPLSELPDLLKALTKAVSEQGEKITAMTSICWTSPRSG